MGEIVVEVDRGEIRAGRLCLTADGPATFPSLQVRGLDLYAFPFGVSRFTSFGEHIGSWDGRLHELAPDALGPGTTTATVAELWSSTAAEVAAAMAPEAPSAERERVFAAWVAGLGLPLQDDVTTLELSRVVAGAQTRALLIESPEPLDFTEEIDAVLIHRTRTGPRPPRPPRPPLDPISLATRLRSVRDGLERVSLEPPRPDRRPDLPPVDETILDVEPIGDDLRLRLHPALANAGELFVVAVETDTVRLLYSGIVRPDRCRESRSSSTPSSPGGCRAGFRRAASSRRPSRTRSRARCSWRRTTSCGCSAVGLVSRPRSTCPSPSA